MARLSEIVVDSLDPPTLARFWADALCGYEVRPYDDEEKSRLAAIGLTPKTDTWVAVDGSGPTLWFQKTTERKTRRNRLHFDIYGAERAIEVERLKGLGATIRDECYGYTVMLDPEGNEFCVQDPRPE